MQGHQGDDAVLGLLRLLARRDGPALRAARDGVGVGDQGDLLQELGQAALGGLAVEALLELAGDGLQLLEVLDAGLVLRVLGGLELGEVAAGLEDLGDQVGGGERLGGGAQLVQQGDEVADGVDRAGRHARDVLGHAQRLPEGDPLPGRVRLDARLGPVADAAFRDVQDAAQGDGVLGVGEAAQVGQRVADLLALVEPDAADDLVRQPDPDEHFLEDTGLRVGAVEDGDVGGARVALVGEPVDLPGDERGLVVLVVGHIAGDLVALALVGPELLRLAVGVALDDRVGRGQDRLRGAVVLLQQDRRRVRVVALELQDVADRGAAERVDRLVGVADHAQFGRAQPFAAVGRAARDRGGQLPDELVLRVVGVLVLVDQDVPEAPPVVLGGLREHLQQVDRHHDQVVEVHGAACWSRAWYISYASPSVCSMCVDARFLNVS